LVGFLFKLETEDVTLAEPPTMSSAVPNWRSCDTIPLGTGRCAWSAFETTMPTPTNRLCSSLRTLPDEY
jgi:hypothetical protein